MNKIKQPAFILLIALLCSSCPRPLWLPDRNLKEYVKEQDVIGAWNLEQSSIAVLSRDGFKPDPAHLHHIQFLDDGVCIFRSIINDFRGGRYHNVTGAWKLQHDTTGSSNIKKKNTIQLELSLPDGTHVRYLNFDKVDGDLILWQFYGDPDSWEFMEYKKAE